MKRQQRQKRQTCYIYLRVSTAVQVDGFSLDAQRDCLLKEAEHRGYQVLGEYSDAGHSGKNVKGRPEFQRMLDDIRTAKAEDRPLYVFVFKLSRFGRNAADTLSSLQFLEDYGVNLLCVKDGIDSAGAAGKLMISVVAAVAEIERENIQEQTMAGRWQKARKGLWNGGFAPYGYRLEDGKLKIADDEADLIREIFRMFTEENVGINTVAKRLNGAGLKKKIRNNCNTDRIGTSFVKSVLDNPIYAGFISYGRRKTERIDGTRNEFHVVKQNDFDLFEGQHEAIISEEIWHKARKKREKTGYKRVKQYSFEHAHILSGILRCPICGASMYGNVNRKKKPDGTYYKDIWYYVCKNRTTVSGQPCHFKKYVRQDEVNAEIFAIVRGIFDRNNINESLAKDVLADEFDTELLQDQLKQMSERLKTVRGKKERLLSKISDMDANDPLYDELYDDYSRVIRAFMVDIADLESQMEDIRLKIDSNGIQRESVEILSNRISEMWSRLDTLDESYVKQFLADFIDRVDILETPDIIDGVKYWVRRVKFKVPFGAGTPNEHDTYEIQHSFQPDGVHVETVVLLSRVK